MVLFVCSKVRPSPVDCRKFEHPFPKIERPVLPLSYLGNTARGRSAPPPIQLSWVSLNAYKIKSIHSNVT